MIVRRPYGLPVHPTELVAASQNVCGRGVDDDFLTREERQPQVQAVVGLHFVVHQAGQLRIVVRTTAAEAVGHTDNGAQAWHGVLQCERRIVAGGVLGRRQFGILPILPAGYIIGIGKIILEMMQRHVVEKEEVEALAIAVAVRSNLTDTCPVGLGKRQPAIVLVVTFGFQQAAIAVVPGA